MQFTIHAAEGDTDYIAVMKLAAEIVAQLEPQFVDQIDIFRPQPRRMRPQVHEYRWPVRGDDFQREWMPRLRHSFPGPAYAPRKLVRIHSRRNAADQSRCSQCRGRLNHRVEWIHSRDSQEF